MEDYQKHGYGNIECKRNSSYSYQFCLYIEYKQNGFQKHLQFKPTCEQFYNEKSVTIDQILEFPSGQVSKNISVPIQTFNQYKRVAASGIVDTI